jgi:preprotein translocase subunit SecG
MQSILTSVHVLIAVTLIGLILIQHGKGADMGAAFGSGASGTVFGSQGSASFLTRTTAALPTVFFLNSLVLAYMASHRPQESSVVERIVVEQPLAPPSDVGTEPTSPAAGEPVPVPEDVPVVPQTPPE